MNLEPISILIVDDDETVGRLLARCCDDPDFKVIDVVAVRASAIAAVHDHTPDVERAATAAGCWAVVGKTLTIAQDLPDLVRRAAAG